MPVYVSWKGERKFYDKGCKPTLGRAGKSVGESKDGILEGVRIIEYEPYPEGHSRKLECFKLSEMKLSFLK